MKKQRDELLAAKVDAPTREEVSQNQRELVEVAAAIGRLPAPKMVYAGTVHHGSGAFTGTGANGGQPRPIHVLHRGDVKQPKLEAQPGALRAIQALPGLFDLPAGHAEGDRRAMLARWLTANENPLTWRSIIRCTTVDHAPAIPQISPNVIFINWLGKRSDDSHDDGPSKHGEQAW